MDNSLFSKYSRQLKESGDKKETIIQAIAECSGITLTKEDVSLNKKEVKLFISSAKRARLTQSSVRDVLGKAGYTLSY